MMHPRPHRFAKQYHDAALGAVSAIRTYASEVRDRSFPETGKHTYAMASNDDSLALIEWTEGEVRRKEERERIEAEELEKRKRTIRLNK